MENLYEALTPLFRDVFDDDSLTVTAQLTPESLPAWDSLTNIRLLVSIERAFGIEFAADEVALPPSAASLVALLQAHLPKLERAARE